MERGEIGGREGYGRKQKGKLGGDGEGKLGREREGGEIRGREGYGREEKEGEEMEKGEIRGR